jgi:hypothetical protein
MGASRRAQPGDEPALQASDLACECDLADYVAGHRFASVGSARSAYARRRTWLAWRLGLSASSVDETLRATARAHCVAGASRPDAWAYASKQAVAAHACVRPPRLETAAERLDRRARRVAGAAVAP